LLGLRVDISKVTAHERIQLLYSATALVEIINTKREILSKELKNREKALEKDDFRVVLLNVLSKIMQKDFVFP
jgi:hypothetical protein